MTITIPRSSTPVFTHDSNLYPCEERRDLTIESIEIDVLALLAVELIQGETDRILLDFWMMFSLRLILADSDEIPYDILIILG